jgi:hypothetical protein
VAGAEPDWEPPLRFAEASGDGVLFAEVALRAAGFQLRCRRAEGAREVLRRVRPTIAEVGRQEPLLRALWMEVQGLEFADAGALAEAIASLTDALAAMESLGATWHALRAELALAVIERRAGQSATARSRAAKVCRRSTALGLDLPMDEEQRVMVLDAAAGGESACAVWARRKGWRATSPSRFGARLEPAIGRLTVGDAQWTLGRRALPFRLWQLLAAAGPRGVTARELCRRLWRSTPYGPQVVARLRTLVARTRALTEPEHLLLLTVRGEARYAWNPDVPAVSVSVIEDGR